MRSSLRLLPLALALAFTSGCSLLPGQPEPTAAPPASVAPSASFSPAPHNDGPATAPTTPAAPSAQTTAETFARAWARPDLGAQEWLAGVIGYATPSYGQLLRSVDPGRIPARKITGPATPTSSTVDIMVFDVPTDVGTLTITCQNVNGTWLVAGVELRRNP